MADAGYPPQVLEAFGAPRHANTLAEGSGRVIEGTAGQRATGGAVSFACRVDQGELQHVAWGAYGSPYLLAGCELAARALRGEPPEALQMLSASRLARDMAAPADRLGELLVIEDALRKCWLAWENSWL